MIEATPIAKVKYRVSTIEEGRSLMSQGKTDAIIVIPHALEKSVYKQQAPTINLFLNNTNLVKGGLLKAGLYKTFASISGRIKLQTFIRSGLTEEQAYEKVMPIGLDKHILFNPFGNYAYFLTLGLLPVMLTVFTFLGTVYALGIELKDGSAGELMDVANQNVLTAITGKFAPYTFIYFINAMVMNLILFKSQGTPIYGSLSIILVSEFMMILAYQALAVLFLTVTSNLRLSLSLGSAYTMMALTFSGLTFPTMAMPWIAKVFAYIFPYTAWLKVFLSQTLRDEPIREVIMPLCLLIIYFLTGMASFPSMKKKLTNPMHWGKD